MAFMEDLELDLRRYNAPTSKTEVAAIFVGDDGELLLNRTFVFIRNIIRAKLYLL
jgi:hypothetical protein